MLGLFNNIWIKLVALAMGLLLWFHVVTEKRYNYELTLPVTEIALKDDLTLSRFPPDSIMVVVSATGKQLLRKRWRDRGLKISAIQFQTGRHELALSATNVLLVGDDKAIRLEEVLSPNNVTLEIDFLSTTDVTVIPDLSPEPAEGFAVEAISEPEPEHVTVSGPRSLLGRITSVFTERKELAGLRNEIPLRLALQLPSGYGISLNPDSVSVTVRVVPVKTRVLGNVPIVVFNAPANRNIQVLPPVLTVEVSGPPSAIDSLNPTVVLASVDYNEKFSTDSLRVSVQCPAAFKVRTVSASSVRLLEK